MMKQKNKNPIHALYNEHGYTIEQAGIALYSAGNHPLESTLSVDPRYCPALSLEVIRKHAEQMGEEMALELGVMFAGAEYEGE